MLLGLMGFLAIVFGLIIGHKISKHFVLFGTVQGILEQKMTFYVIGLGISFFIFAGISKAAGILPSDQKKTDSSSYVTQSQKRTSDATKSEKSDDSSLVSSTTNEPEESYESSDASDESDSDVSANTGSDYILPDADKAYYTRNELSELDAQELRLAKNEIYARHGLLFNDQELQRYFDSKSWYQGSIPPGKFDDNVLNKYEKENIDLIVSMQKDS